MKKLLLVCLCLFVFTTIRADAAVYEDIEDLVRMVYSRLPARARDISYVEGDFMPPTWSQVMSVNDLGCTHMLLQMMSEGSWEDFMEWDFYYNDDGLLTSFDQHFYLTGMVFDYYFYDITYDAENRITECWMDFDSGYGNPYQMHEVFEYGSDGLTYWIATEDIGMGSFDNLEQATFNWSNGDLIEGEYEYWDFGSMQWMEEFKFTFSYSGGLLDTVLQEEHDGSQWQNVYFYDYNMINQYLPQDILIQEWQGGSWINDDRITLTYPRVTYDERLQEDWDGSEWINERLHQTIFNNNDQPIQVDGFGWNGSEWEEYDRVILSYGPSGVDPNTVVPVQNLTNYPNPFNPSTTISFSLTAKDAKDAKIEIYNLKGQKVKTLPVSPSPSHTISVAWDGTDDNSREVSSGVYLYQLKEKGNPTAVRKMLLMK